MRLWTISALDRKLLRDMIQLKGQLMAISAVMACGIATFIMMRSALNSLTYAKESYYVQSHFGELFGSLKRAPDTLIPRIAEIPGVAAVQTRIVRAVTLDVPGLIEPAAGRLISIPETGRDDMNRLHIRRGRYIEPGNDAEVLASEGFCKKHGFLPGDSVTAIMNGRRKDLKIVGIALSPEYVYQIHPGALVPDDLRFGVFWMGKEALAATFDMTGAFNDVSLELIPGASDKEVIDHLDRLLLPYGGLGVYNREDQISNRFISDEIRQLGRMGSIVPTIFLGVAAFLLNVVLSRIISLQRDQIAALKAFGYSNYDVGLHYLKLVLLITILGTLMGIAAGVYLGNNLMGLYIQFYRFPELNFLMPYPMIGVAFIVSSAAAVTGTLNVVRAAIALPPAEAMRPEPPASYGPTLFERIGLSRLLSQTTRMILRNIERRPVKSGLSICGMAMSIAIVIMGRFTADSLDYLLDVQFSILQRQDMTLYFFEAMAPRTLHAVEHLPGVMNTEPFRVVPVRMQNGNRSRRISITGFPARHDLTLLRDTKDRIVTLPEDGLVLNTKLAEVMGVKVGELLTLEILEGARPTRQVPVTATVNEYLGTTAYMSLSALNRLMREGDNISGVYVQMDDARVKPLYQEIKETPKIASVHIKEASIRSFRETVMNNLLQMQFFNAVFACIIAFGVIYNTARVALSERGRELASLRVIGLTRGEISYILLGELAVLTLIAIPVGLSIGYGLVCLVAEFMNSELYRIPVVVSPMTYAFAICVTLFSAIISGLVVRRKLDHLDLIAVLKTRE